MRLTDLSYLELVDLTEGIFMGPVGKSDLMLDEKTGKIKAIISKKNNSLLSWRQKDRELFIPWETIIKVGKEMVVFKINDKENSL